MAANPYGLAVGQYVTSQLGGGWTPEKARFFHAWSQAEGTSAAYNPFATTRRGYPGETQFNSVGVKNYPNLAVGQRATLETIKNGHYDQIVGLLKRDDVTAEQLAAAVANSPWGTGAGVLRVLGVKAATDYEKTTSRQKWSVKKAIVDQPFQAEIAAINRQVQAINEVQSRLVTQSNQLLTPSAGWLGTLNRLGAGGRKLASVAQGFQPIQAQATPMLPVVEADAKQDGGTVVAKGPALGSNETVQKILDIANAQIGKPYVWGAEGPKAFDCSGLIEYAFEQAGVPTPGRITTQTAINMGKKVSKSNMQPGDWIVSQGHMVMYVGNGQVIAAPRTGTVVQYQPASKFMGKEYQVRRVLS